MNSRLKKITENNKTFLIYKLNESDTIDSMSVNMLKNNDILHILPISFTQIGEEKYLRYDVTSKTSLSDAIKYPVSKERFLAIYDGIFSGIINLDDFMIPANTLLLNTDQIYFDEYNEFVYLISFPVNVSESINIDYAEFTRTLTNRVQLQANDEFITGKVLNRLNQTQTFSVGEFQKFIKGLKEEKLEKKVAVNSTEPVEQSVQPQTKLPVVVNTSQPNSSVVQVQRSVQPQQPENKQSVQGKLNIPGQQKGGMNIPGKQPVQNNTQNQGQSQTVDTDPNEPQISLFYLLQHYNAENAALYKKQKEAKKNGAGNSKKHNTPQGVALSQQQRNPQPNYVKQPVTYVEQREPQKRNFGNTTDLNGRNKKKTTVLNGKTAQPQSTAKHPILIRKRNNERISITKTPFILGASEDGDVDYILRGNTNISQTHATIGYEVKGFTISDNDSTNGTYLNANPISPGQYMLLNPGDYIRMADEDFKFEII